MEERVFVLLFCFAEGLDLCFEPFYRLLLLCNLDFEFVRVMPSFS
jgi:hypothetical protein